MARKSTGISIPKQEDDWQVECDLRTLMEAEKIEKDPKRMKRARALANKKLLEVAVIAGDSE